MDLTFPEMLSFICSSISSTHNFDDWFTRPHFMTIKIANNFLLMKKKMEEETTNIRIAPPLCALLLTHAEKQNTCEWQRHPVLYTETIHARPTPSVRRSWINDESEKVVECGQASQPPIPHGNIYHQILEKSPERWKTQSKSEQGTITSPNKKKLFIADDDRERQRRWCKKIVVNLHVNIYWDCVCYLPPTKPSSPSPPSLLL